MYRDAVVAIGLIVAAIAAIAGVWHLQGGASLYPIAMAVGLLVGAVLLFGVSIAGRRVHAKEETEAEGAGLLPTVATTFVFAFAVPWVGFYPATFFYLAILFLWQSSFRPSLSVLIAAVMTAAIYVVFGYFLAVPTPDGLAASLFQG